MYLIKIANLWVYLRHFCVHVDLAYLSLHESTEHSTVWVWQIKRCALRSSINVTLGSWRVCAFDRPLCTVLWTQQLQHNRRPYLSTHTHPRPPTQLDRAPQVLPFWFSPSLFRMFRGGLSIHVKAPYARLSSTQKCRKNTHR